MSIESTLNHAPPWNKAIATKLEPLGIAIDVMLLAVAILCVWVVVSGKSSSLKAMLLAFIVSP